MIKSFMLKSQTPYTYPSAVPAIGVPKQMIEPHATPATIRRGSIPRLIAIVAAIGQKIAITAALLINCVMNMDTKQKIVARMIGFVRFGNALLKRFEIHSPVPDAVIALESGSVPATRKITLQLTELNAS